MGIAVSTPDKRLADIVAKVQSGERLTLEDGVFLYESDELLTIGQLANEVNLRKNGKYVYFIENMSLYFTNVCEDRCAFCHFRRDEGAEGAYTLNPDEILEYVGKHYQAGMREFHITGGHNPNVPFDYYVNSIRILKENYPDVTIKAYTGAEIDFFSRISGLSYQGVLEKLIEAGLGTLPGGGAEILTDRYRSKMNVEKATSQQWLDVHRTAHKLGLKTHATMLYGAIETKEERIRHMLQLRELQDETGGFMVFIPNSVQPANAGMGIRRRTSAFDDLKTIAISRLMLDNIPHVKAYFINLGTQLAQLAFTFGASDAHGTIIQERISHSAGALSPEGLTRQELVHMIKGANRIPVERDTFYNVIREFS